MNMNKNYLIKYLLSNESHNLIYHHKTTQIVSNQFIKLKRQKFWKRKLGQRDWQTDDKTVKKIIVPYVFIGSKDKLKKNIHFLYFSEAKSIRKQTIWCSASLYLTRSNWLTLCISFRCIEKKPKKLTNFPT